MRSLLLSLALVLLLLAPAEVRGQYPSYYYGSYSPYTYAPPYPLTYGNYYSPPVYSQPYLWSGRYYTNPWNRGWVYERYYPYTNQYFYGYRVMPHGWWWY